MREYCSPRAPVDCSTLIYNIVFMLTHEDQVLLAQKGITEEQLQRQLQDHAAGFPFLDLDAAASVVNGGILTPSEVEAEAYRQAWDRYTADAEHRVVKFVPASGAASRMFKDLFAFLDADYEVPTTEFEQYFFARLADAPFLTDLNVAVQRLYGKDVTTLVAEGAYKAIIVALLGEDGLNYGKLPKGLLKFHRYGTTARTPFEEHLVEGALYAKDREGHVHVHFTVSPEHRSLFEQLATEAASRLGEEYATKFDLGFSEQKPSTDTVAAQTNGQPFRNADGSLLFRPGGHGALIENLNEVEADVVFVKNIDNVVPDRLKCDTVNYKKLLAGILVNLQERVFAYLDELDEGNLTDERAQDILRFLETELCCKSEAARALDGLELLDYLYCKLNRPMRVCGMVRNVGEPGGGPFWAYNPDGTVSLQILESSQIDMSDSEKKAMFAEGTHFNPVDLVCGVKDYCGEAFDLREFVDPATGFISDKSKDGKVLRALELPGLWNGAMSDWITLFVEVPLSTFNPVKTVNDLYREQHQ